MISNMSLELELHGTRGSLPTPLRPAELLERLRAFAAECVSSGAKTPAEVRALLERLPAHESGGFGGNTACTEVRLGSESVLIDAGSGIRTPSERWMSGACGQGRGEVHLFFTHFHWDHLLGLPFFGPLFIPGNVVHVYAVQPELEAVFKNVFRKPYFPVPFEALQSRIRFHRLKPREAFRHGGMSLTPYQLDHPDPCWGYRVEGGGKALAYCVDTECKRVTRSELGADLPLYRNADLMVFDAQYTIKEVLEKVDWGHATAIHGIEIALREDIKRILFMHNDPASSDAKIHLSEMEADRYFKARVKELQGRRPALEWGFAIEGTVIKV